jgi:hypothetical protein
MSDVDITISFPWQGHEVGERVTVSAIQAKRLVRAGVGRYATKKDAKAAGDEPAQATTATTTAAPAKRPRKAAAKRPTS